MDRKADLNALPAETFALQITLGSVLASLARIDPVIQEAINDGFAAAASRTAVAKMGKRASTQRMAAVLRTIQEMRSMVNPDAGNVTQLNRPRV